MPPFLAVCISREKLLNHKCYFPFQIRLYDHRLLQRGAVQCYEGHVNSHTRIQIGVDPAERFVMSGGCCFSDGFLFCILGLNILSFQVERIASYGYGVSSLVNCFLRTSSLIQLSPLCAIKHTVVRTISSQPFCFRFYKFYYILFVSWLLI